MESALAFCGALAREVDGLGEITWTYEDSPVQSGAGPAWEAVFSLGITEADDGSRQAIATAVAVATDAAGYAAVRASAPEDLRTSLDRLHRLVQETRRQQSSNTTIPRCSMTSRPSSRPRRPRNAAGNGSGGSGPALWN